MNSQVVDTSALLALINGEPGAATVEEAMDGPDALALCSVNLAELASKLAEAGMSPHAIRDLIGSLHLDIYEFVVEDALTTGLLRPLTRPLGLSLGDRACLALARRLRLPVLTTDRAWASVAAGVTIQVIR